MDNEALVVIKNLLTKEFHLLYQLVPPVAMRWNKPFAHLKTISLLGYVWPTMIS
jgi:hypothetical protein